MAGKKEAALSPDRPLSKAYLREFGGYSTAYPPGLSDPASLRLMENVQVTREGAARVRPALRSVLTENVWLDANYQSTMVGGFEHFFLNDGSKALLFAARQPSGAVGFKVAAYNAATRRFDIKNLTEEGIGFAIPQGEATLDFSSATTFVKYLQIDNKIFALSNGGEDLRLFNVGSTKNARKVTAINRPLWDAADALTIVHPDAAWINNPVKNTVPAAETPTAETLIKNVPGENTYSYGYFYTFENEVGESAASQIKMVKAQRGWSQWRFTAPDASGNPSSINVTDPPLAMDQLVATIPEATFWAAIGEGAVKWNLYMFTWSQQDAVPPEGIRVASRDLTGTVTYQTHGWLQNLASVDLDSGSMPLPTENNRYDYSDPSNASQGLVAGDRLVLVNDRENGAVIRWSSNQVGEYTNFSPSRGGGFKTLTSGNLYIPAAVKLWQNPQSVDTITILCSGVDGYSTSYYMAPAIVSGQSDNTAIMGFEETTATPGTVSPYGVEVLNNALYHPLDTELMKSTAANYNINHSTMTDDIANKWTELLNKHNIVSSQHDNRLYYLVHNPDGEELTPGCNGNEVWVFDGAQDQGSWSRWLVQGISLSKLEVGGKLYMSVSRPESIFVFDDLEVFDEVSHSGGTIHKPIKWMLETNTQGANRAHDAWAYVQQMSVIFGSWRGSVKYGIRGVDTNGKMINVSKVYHRPLDEDLLRSREMPFDIEDFLRIGRNLKEWFFYASSVADGDDVKPSHGRISLVQYRYTPVSVNVGYEFGTVESHEYGRSSRELPSNTTNGVPLSYIDTSRP